MDTKDILAPTQIEALALELLTPLEDECDHPEIWLKIASLKQQDNNVIKQLGHYYSQLMRIPQAPPVLRLLAVMEAMCLAYSEMQALAATQLQQLMQQHPQSLLIKGALSHVQKLTIPENTTNMDSLFQVLSEWMSIQKVVNANVMNKLNHLERMISFNGLALQQQIHHSQQSLHMLNKQLPNAPRRIRCVFLVSFLQAWNTLAAVYQEMRHSADFEPIVISTARKRSKDNQSIFGEEEVHDFLLSQGIDHLRLNTALPENNALDVLKALAPDLIFRQSAYHDLPPIFNAADISFARLCYIPYSFTAVKRIGKDESKDVTASATHTDLYYHRLCWRIFCETEMHHAMYVDTSVRKGENVVVTGYPKFDHLLASKAQPAFWPITTKDDKKRFRLIWAPHHSVTPDVMGFGTFVESHKAMLEWAKESEAHYEFVLKPHPALVSEVVHTLKAFSQEYMDGFFAAWKALPNTALFEGGDYGALFVGSDALITDGVGFLSEYQLFEKPLIFLDSGKHFGFNAAGQVVMQSANQFTSVEAIKSFCDQLRAGIADPMRDKQKAVLAQLLPYPGESAKRIVEAIREGLRKEGMNLLSATV